MEKPMTTFPCVACRDIPTGEGGHPGLSLYVGGPYPGQNIFKCGACSERWIRHYGSPDERFAWTRYSEKFSVRAPQAVAGAKAFV